MARIIWPRLERARRLTRSVRGTAFGLALIGLVACIPQGIDAYFAQQLQRSPQADLIGFMQTQASTSPQRLVFTEQTLYQQVHPYLHENYDLRLAGGDSRFAGAPAPDAVLPSQAAFWLIPTGSEGQRVQSVAENREAPTVRYILPSTGEIQRYGAESPPLARSEVGITLVSAQVETRREGLSVTLYWHAQAIPPDMAGDYTVFVQVLDAQGVLVAGHDSKPANGNNPTPTWQANELIPDQHPLTLPADAPDSYQIVAGMYSSDGTRLVFTRANGSVWADGAVVVAD